MASSVFTLRAVKQDTADEQSSKLSYELVNKQTGEQRNQKIYKQIKARACHAPFHRLVLGYLLGHVQVLVLRPPPHMRPHVIAMTTVGNMISLPLVLVVSLANDAPDLFGPDAEVLGPAYVAFG